MKHKFQKNWKLRKCKTYQNLTLFLWAFGQYLRKSVENHKQHKQQEQKLPDFTTCKG